MYLLAYLFFIPFYTGWLLICAALAAVGSIVPSQKKELDVEKVKASKTVCRVLHEKGLISDVEYEFETTQVAGHYDPFTFNGYMLVMAPMIFFLQKVNYYDSMIMFLLKKWMLVHHNKFGNQTEKPHSFYFGLAKICVTLAWSLGKFLSLFNLGQRESEDVQRRNQYTKIS